MHRLYQYIIDVIFLQKLLTKSIWCLSKTAFQLKQTLLNLGSQPENVSGKTEVVRYFYHFVDYSQAPQRKPRICERFNITIFAMKVFRSSDLMTQQPFRFSENFSPTKSKTSPILDKIVQISISVP